jgi:hypothetical protein
MYVKVIWACIGSMVLGVLLFLIVRERQKKK